MNELASLGLAGIRKITDTWAGLKSDSLIDYTKETRVEPIALIDADVLHVEMLPDVMQSLSQIFSGYYLQAVAISTNVGKIETKHHLDKLNPRRSPIDSAVNSGGFLMAMESYKDRLPTYETAPSLEALSDRVGNAGKGIIKALNDEGTGKSENGFGKDTTSVLKDLANLSVGRLINVEISDGNHKAVIPIAIRIMASTLPTASLVHILSVGNEDKSAKERYHGYKSGRLGFIRDIVMCQDIIDAHRSALMNDKTGILSDILKRNRANQLSTLVSGNPSVATASNLVVLSTDTIAQLELKINGRMADYKTRQKVFKNTYVMIMAVIDKKWERVTFYHRGIDRPTEVSLKDMRAANKGSGPDVSDILRAYQLGNAPSL